MNIVQILNEKNSRFTTLSTYIRTVFWPLGFQSCVFVMYQPNQTTPVLTISLLLLPPLH